MDEQTEASVRRASDAIWDQIERAKPTWEMRAVQTAMVVIVGGRYMGWW
jgi:hypothetical protein